MWVIGPFLLMRTELYANGVRHWPIQLAVCKSCKFNMQILKVVLAQICINSHKSYNYMHNSNIFPPINAIWSMCDLIGRMQIMQIGPANKIGSMIIVQINMRINIKYVNHANKICESISLFAYTNLCQYANFIAKFAHA